MLLRYYEYFAHAWEHYSNRIHGLCLTPFLSSYLCLVDLLPFCQIYDEYFAHVGEALNVSVKISYL
jgi:hypothetical protein